MNPRLELYRSGSALVINTVYGKKGRRAVVVDAALRARQAAREMAAAGHDVETIARTLHRPRAFIRMAIKKSWI